MTAQARKNLSVGGVLAMVVAVIAILSYVAPAFIFPSTVAAHADDIKVLKDKVATLQTFSAGIAEKVDNTDKRTERIENKLDQLIFIKNQ